MPIREFTSSPLDITAADYQLVAGGTITAGMFTTLSPLQVNLPDPSTCFGRVYRIKVVGGSQTYMTFNYVIYTGGANKVDVGGMLGVNGGANLNILAGNSQIAGINNNSLLFQSDGVNWWFVGL